MHAAILPGDNITKLRSTEVSRDSSTVLLNQGWGHIVQKEDVKGCPDSEKVKNNYIKVNSPNKVSYHGPGGSIIL